MRCFRISIGVAVLAAGLGLAAPSLAQDNARDAAPGAPREPGREAAGDTRAAPPGRGNPANRDAVVGEMKDAEVRHRERLAMIGRLRELATAKGQTERLAALDKLETKERGRYDRHLEKQRARLGDDEHRKVKERLSKGRQKDVRKDKEKAKAKEPERAKPADPPKDAPKEREKEKPKDTEKPKADRGDAGQGQERDKPKDKGRKTKPGTRT